MIKRGITKVKDFFMILLVALFSMIMLILFTDMPLDTIFFMYSLMALLWAWVYVFMLLAPIGLTTLYPYFSYSKILEKEGDNYEL